MSRRDAERAVSGQVICLLALLAWSWCLCSIANAAEAGRLPAEWRGVWRLDQDAGASAVSALDRAQVGALLGTILRLDDDVPALGGFPCSSPHFEVTSETKDDFAADFRVQPDKVGITGNSVRLLQVDCKSYAYSFIRLSADRGLVIYQGHFFGANNLGDR